MVLGDRIVFRVTFPKRTAGDRAQTISGIVRAVSLWLSEHNVMLTDGGLYLVSIDLAFALRSLPW